MVNILAWLVLSLVFGWLAFPLAFRLFPKLADRGYSFSKALGLLISSWFFWLLACGQILPNSAGGVVLAVLALGGLSFLCLRKKAYREIFAWCKSHKGLIISVEILFLVSFGALALLRAMNPDIANTEKPMELAFINSILQSPAFPPADPWLSGYSISYYYFGYVMIAVMIRLSGISSSIGYNLAAAMWFGLSAVGAYGIIFNLVSRYQEGRHIKRQPFLAGLFGPLFVLIVSNLEGFLEVLYSKGFFWKVEPSGETTSPFWTWLNILDINQAPIQKASWIPQRWMWWWRASRVVTQYDLVGNHKEIIDEFPFFSYLLSDLHPHVLAMPFVLLAIGIGLHFFLKWVDEGAQRFVLLKWMRTSSFWVCALCFGSLGFLNTWDLPFYLAFISVLFALARFREMGHFWKRTWDFLRFFLFLLAAGILIFLPFYLSFQSQAGGILPSLEFFTRGNQFWVMFGPLLIPICCWLTWQAWKQRKQVSFAHGAVFTLSVLSLLFGISWLLGWMLSSAQAWGEHLLLSSSTVLKQLGSKLQSNGVNFSYIHSNVPQAQLLTVSFLERLKSPGTIITVGLIIFISWSLLSRRQKGQENEGKDEHEARIGSGDDQLSLHGFIPVMILFGAALAVAPEFVYLQDQFGWPINTYFKFYFAAWMFWGLAAGLSLWSMASQMKKGWRCISLILTIVIVLAGLVYPLLSAYNKTNNFDTADLTLDGLAYRFEQSAGEEEGIQWIKNSPYGVIAEAIGGQYSEFARIATETGYPNVLGWPGHEHQWRGGADEIGSRESDVKILYETSDWEIAREILDLYQIRYVIVGAMEEARYPDLEEQKFRNNLTIGFQNPFITIYEVQG